MSRSHAFTRQRGAFGKLVKWTFVAFNLFMLLWLISGINAVSGIRVDSAAAQAGAFIGASIGFGMILSLWVMGDIILGIMVLLTRGDKIIIEETTGGGSSTRSFSGSDASNTAADEIVTRYIEKQRALSAASSAPRTQGLAPASVQRGFGRRQ